MFIEIFFLTHIALIPIFLQEFHLTLVQVSIIVTIPTVVSLLVNVFSGFLVDKVGAKSILVIGIFIQGLGGIVIAKSGDITLLIIGLACIGIAAPFYHVSGYSTISKVASKGEFSKAIGIHNAMGSVGKSLGVLTLPVILLYSDWRFLYFMWSIPIIIWSLILIRIKVIIPSLIVQRNEDQQPLRSVLSKDFVSFLSTITIHQSGLIVVTTFITTYLIFSRGFSEVTSSMIFALAPPIGIISSILAGYLVSRHGEIKILTVIMIGAACSGILIPFTSTTLSLILLFLCFSFFREATWAPIMIITANLSHQSRRGLAYSLATLTFQAVSIGFPPITAILIEATDIGVIFPLSFSLIVLGLLNLTVSSKKYFTIL